MKKNKWYALKLEEDFSFTLESQLPKEYHGKLVKQISISDGPRFMILERIYDREERTSKPRMFFQKYTLRRGDVAYDLCEAVWKLL